MSELSTSKDSLSEHSQVSSSMLYLVLLSMKVFIHPPHSNSSRTSVEVTELLKKVEDISPLI